MKKILEKKQYLKYKILQKGVYRKSRFLKHKKLKIIKKTNKKVSLIHPKYAEEIFNIKSEDEDNEFDDDDEDTRDENDAGEYDQNSNDNPRQRMFDQKWPKLKKLLFNVVEDPEERTDLFESNPEIVEKLRLRVRELLGSFVERDYPDQSKRGRPKNFHNVWSPGWC